MTLGAKLSQLVRDSAAITTLIQNRFFPGGGEISSPAPFAFYQYVANTDNPTHDDSTLTEGEHLDSTRVQITAVAFTHADASTIIRLVRNLLRASQTPGSFAVNLESGPNISKQTTTTGTVYQADIDFSIHHNLQL